jgi:hypothetical protein
MAERSRRVFLLRLKSLRGADETTRNLRLLLKEARGSWVSNVLI